MDWLIVFLLLILLGTGALLFHKVRRIHLATFRLLDAAADNADVFRQFQAYDGLMRLIQPRRPLPLLRGWAASPDLLLTLAQHALTHRPKAVLECSSGSTTVVLARCCELNGAGHVYSLEHDERFARQTRELLEAQGLESWATVIDAPLTPGGSIAQPWYSLDGLRAPAEGFDMLVIDGPPSKIADAARHPALSQLDPMLNAGATVFLDDADRPGERRALKRWAQEFPHYHQTHIPLEKGAVRMVKADPAVATAPHRDGKTSPAVA